MQPDATASCLRCAATALRKLDSPEGVAFFECPSCHRHYAREAGGALTYRWGHPISLALYGALFDPDPLPEAPRIAEFLRKGRTAELIGEWAEEIALELAHPTQAVRDILGNPSSEAACREFLAAVVQQLQTTGNKR